jgi:hypothetical protein
MLVLLSSQFSRATEIFGLITVDLGTLTSMLLARCNWARGSFDKSYADLAMKKA